MFQGGGGSFQGFRLPPFATNVLVRAGPERTPTVSVMIAAAKGPGARTSCTERLIIPTGRIPDNLNTGGNMNRPAARFLASSIALIAMLTSLSSLEATPIGCVAYCANECIPEEQFSCSSDCEYDCFEDAVCSPGQMASGCAGQN